MGNKEIDQRNRSIEQKGRPNVATRQLNSIGLSGGGAGGWGTGLLGSEKGRQGGRGQACQWLEALK